MMTKNFERFAPIAVLILILLLWQAVVSLFNIAEFIFPSPLQIAKEFIEFKEPLLKAAW